MLAPSITGHAMTLPPMRHFSAIDGMRALAVVAVIVFHADSALLPGGFTGVDLFFVVSGFVISQSLAARPEQTLGRFLLAFYRRRAQRLLPALLLMLLVTFALSALLLPRAWRNEQFDQTGLAALFGVSNLVLAWQQDGYFSPGADLNPFLHTWTLGVEEQFYLLFPFVYFIWLQQRRRHAAARWLLPALALASLAVAAVQTTAAPTSAFYLLPARFWELAAGALLYQRVMTQSAPLHWRHLALPGVLLLVLGFVFAARVAFPFPGALITVIGTLMLLAATAATSGHGRARSVVLSVLQWPALTYLGLLSYSLYLWHWPLLVVLRWTYGWQDIAVWIYPVLLIAVASASYHWIENPARRRSSRFRSGSVLAMALAAVAVSASTSYLLVQHSDDISLSTTADGHQWRPYLHPAWKPVPPIDGPTLDGRQLFVVGDSHAAAYRSMVSVAARQLGMQLHVLEQGGCGIVTLLGSGTGDAACDGHRERILAQIDAQARPGDIVLLASLRMPELRGRDWRRGNAVVLEEIAGERDPAAARAAKQQAEAVLARLDALSVITVIDAPLPVFKAAAYRCSDAFNRMNPACAEGVSVPRADLEQLRAPQMALLQSLASTHPALRVWDPFPLLCQGEVCSAMDGDRPLFFDSDHLSGHGNRVLLPDFVATLQRLAADPPGRANSR